MKKKQKIKEQFRNSVFKRDNFKCAIVGCSISDNLDAHHITDRNEMVNGGYEFLYVLSII